MFDRVDGMVQQLDPVVGQDQVSLMDEASSSAKADFFQQVQKVRDMPSPARDVALQALGSGLHCGALDGIALFKTHHLAVDPSPPVVSEPLQDAFGKLAGHLNQTRQVAKDQWAGMPADDLQLLSCYGKHENMKTGEEAEALSQRASVSDFQKFLLATFKAGYAIGLVDAAVVCVAGQVPDPVPD